MTQITPHKLSNIQTLRGLAALLVVFTHLPAMEIKHGGDHILPDFFRFGISGVDLFFVISGFIMIYVTQNTQPGARQSLKFLFARITRIYPIYWLISAALLIAWMFKPGLLTFDPAQTSVLKSFLLWPDQTLPMLKVAWTLVHEMYFYIIFALILCLPTHMRLPGLILWIAIVIGGNLSGFGTGTPELKLVFHPLTLEFFMGAMAAWLLTKSKGRFGRASLIFGTISFIAALTYLSLTLAMPAFPSNWERIFYFGLPAAFIVYGISAIEMHSKPLPKWSATFGDWSYSLYLSHILTLSVLGYMWRPFTRDGALDNVIALSILLIGCICAAAVSWYCVERPMLRFFKHWRARLFP